MGNRLVVELIALVGCDTGCVVLGDIVIGEGVAGIDRGRGFNRGLGWK